MQTERVTYLTSADRKAQLEAFAKARGESVGNVVREATSRFISEPRDESEKEAELSALTDELEAALPEMREDFDAMLGSLRAMNDKIEAYRAEKAQRRKAA
jgi:hypothetical protein